MPNPSYCFGFYGQRPDSRKYSVAMDDSTITAPTEGGYEFTRLRFTRKPRKTWTVGYTEITNANKELFRVFWEDVAKGGSVIFDWHNHEDGLTYAVRFLGDSIKFEYQGIGPTKLWTFSFSLKQA